MKPIAVLTAVSDAVWEADLVAATADDVLGVTVVRRCVDLADLLAVAATGQARAVVLSADLRRLDREALSRLAQHQVAVVALAQPGDSAAQQRLAQLGIAHVLPADASAERVAATLAEAVHLVVAGTAHPVVAGTAHPVVAGTAPEVAWSGQRARAGAIGPGQSERSTSESTAEVAGARGQVIAVWGPQGAPGRTTVAVALASELAGLGSETLLVDADVYGGVIAQLLGLLDESPGLAAACRLAGMGGLDQAALVDLARAVAPKLRVLTGITRPDRWLELRPSSLEVVLERARATAAFTVVDGGFCLERDEELSFDTSAPRRNGATLALVQSADVVVVVGSADPTGLQRLIRGLSDLQEAAPGVSPVVVVNRLRSSAIPGDCGAEVRVALARYAGTERVHLVPMDVTGVDAAVSTGQSLREAAPTSPARTALVSLAAELAGMAAPTMGRRRWSLRRN